MVDGKSETQERLTGSAKSWLSSPEAQKTPHAETQGLYLFFDIVAIEVEGDDNILATLFSASDPL